MSKLRKGSIVVYSKPYEGYEDLEGTVFKIISIDKSPEYDDDAYVISHNNEDLPKPVFADEVRRATLKERAKYILSKIGG